MRTTKQLRLGRVAFSVLAASAIAFGCRGIGERNYFDDSDAGDDVLGPGVDGSTPTDDGSAPVDSGGGGPDAGGDGATNNDASTLGDGGAQRSIGGTVVGLTGTGMVLNLNGGSPLSVPAAGGNNVPFTFGTTLAEGASFAVTIQTQPSSPAQTCSVSGGSGTVGDGNVTSVIVNCLKDKYTVGGTVNGLEGTITLANGADTIDLSANGGFAFPTPLDSAASYSASISGHSALPEQTCTIANASGTITNANVTNIGVSCTTKGYTVGGSTSGTGGGAIKLKLGAEIVTVNGDASFTFQTPVLSTRTYAVTVDTPPAGKTCTVTNGSGTVTTANVNNVSVKCVAQYALVENFDGVAASNLPSGWTSSILYKAGGNPAGWITTTVSTSPFPAPNTAPNSAAVSNEALATDMVLTSPTFTVATDTSKLTFLHWYSLEASTMYPTVAYDGVKLEIAVNGGAFATIPASAFTTGGYTRTIAIGYLNPLAGEAVWSGRSANGWTASTVNLPLTAGQSAQIRFRIGTDKKNDVCSPNPCSGWLIDTLKVAN